MLEALATYILSFLGWGFFWSLLCLGLCSAQLASAPRLVGRAALACGLHQVILVLPPWTYWATWLGLSPSITPSNPIFHPVAWGSQMMGLLLIIWLIYGLKWVTPTESGLCRPWPGTTGRVVLVVLASATALFVDAYLSRHAFTSLWWHERLYFATLPGLVEELFYRGVLVGLLSRAFPHTVPLPGAYTSWGGLVGVLLFALGHHFKFGSNWLLSDVGRAFLQGYGWLLIKQFFSAALFFQLLFGTLFLWVRERTGSVWAAVAAHCLLNGVLVLGHSMN